MNDYDNIGELYSEMALTNMQKIGKWDDKKNRHGYDKASVGILSSPSGLKKLEDKFNRIGNWDFNLYFVKLPNAWKHSEVGKVDLQQIEELLGLKSGVDFPEPGENEITIFFTNNSAAEKVALTSWLIAHRIGHSMAATYRKRYNDNSIQPFMREIDRGIRELLTDCYGVSLEHGRNELIYSNQHIVRNLFESIGKFRSARMKKLPRTGEFIYECFAQYLLADGELSFNEPPENLTDSNKKAWGNDTGRNYRLEDPIYARDIILQLESSFEQLFDYYLGTHIETISIM